VSGLNEAITLGEKDAKALAVKIAKILKPGDCLALHGELGAGKSTFVRAAIQALTDADEVPSPTFTLVQNYDGEDATIWHFDAYRLKVPEEIYELGWEEALTGIVFIEWGERIAGLLPKGHLAIRFEYAQSSSHKPEQRVVTFKGDTSWALRLSPVLPLNRKM
jgi:tRNA threonylcarbamoyladenosine biosynthesis protein TsaE